MVYLGFSGIIKIYTEIMFNTLHLAASLSGTRNEMNPSFLLIITGRVFILVIVVQLNISLHLLIDINRLNTIF